MKKLLRRLELAYLDWAIRRAHRQRHRILDRIDLLERREEELRGPSVFDRIERLAAQVRKQQLIATVIRVIEEDGEGGEGGDLLHFPLTNAPPKPSPLPRAVVREPPSGQDRG